MDGPMFPKPEWWGYCFRKHSAHTTYSKLEGTFTGPSY